ncbi:rhomboid family intramembrane serine protease [Breoghania sp.]|uniref:rhomboid family intramembrane serine protease n=1 Tax=Breoghania sp. TaxID=2065378 RepID=UPI002AA801DF|nr:rhomboid family intramembrane serine protease [Breoghania sp.]
MHPKLARSIKSVSAILAMATIIASVFVAYHANGSPFGTVKVAVLRNYGGTTFADIRNFELWRLITAQIVHVKQGHMLYNAVCLLLVGSLVESKIGPARVLVIWLFAGGLATYVSPIGVEAPWNVGTGASQAVFALAAAALVLIIYREVERMRGGILVAFALIPGLALDFMTVGYPKPGHALALCLGGLLGLLFHHRARSRHGAPTIGEA